MREGSEMYYNPEQIPGHSLCDVNGKEIGRIMGVGPTYVDVATGAFGLGGSLYVPLDAISYCTDTCCYLSMPVEQVKQRDWSTLPEERPTPGFASGTGEMGAVRIPYRREEPKRQRAG